MSTAALQLETLYVLDAPRRIISLREARGRRPPAFALIRGASDVAWGVRADIGDDISRQFDALAAQEASAADLSRPPAHADQYLSLVPGEVWSGPAYVFPDHLPPSDGAVIIGNARTLDEGFAAVGEELEEVSPVVGMIEDGRAVSVCFCSRRSDRAAEAGLETLPTHRRRGYGAKVAAGWGRAVRATGRTPLYSTAWDNEASRAVARKLRLVPYASDWSIADR